MKVRPGMSGRRVGFARDVLHPARGRSGAAHGMIPGNPFLQRARTVARWGVAAGVLGGCGYYLATRTDRVALAPKHGLPARASHDGRSHHRGAPHQGVALGTHARAHPETFLVAAL